MSELPKGWVRIGFGEVHKASCDGINPAKFPDEEFELYSVPSHASGFPEIVPGSAIGSNKQRVHLDTVLLCKINPRINRVWVVKPRTNLRAIASTEWIAFSPRKEIDPNYLAFFMRQSAFRDYLAQHASGVGGSLMRVKPSTFRSFEFVIAPRAEQVRIVAEIEKQFRRLDAATAALQRVQANLKRYRASVLRAACEGRLVRTEAKLARKEGRDYEPADKLLERILCERRARWEADTLARMIASGKLPKDDRWKEKYELPGAVLNGSLPKLPEGWIWTNLSQLKAHSVYGPRFSSDAYSANGVVVLRTSDISASGKVDLFQAPRLQLGKLEIQKYRLVPGDIVFTRTGATVGKIALFDDEVEAIPGAYLIHYRLVFQETVPWFVYRFFQTEVGQQSLVSGTRGIGQPNLNAPTIESIPIPLPPLAEQRRLVQSIDEALTLQSKQSETVRLAQVRSDRLRQALLVNAFSGQLVPQDPSDEPASILLERIRAERASANSPKRSRRSRDESAFA